MPAAELQETGRIPPNAHHSMPEDGCRPCSGLDPPKGMCPWNVSSSRLPLAFVLVLFLFGKGTKVKVGAKAGRPRMFKMEPPAVRVHDGAPGRARSRWSPRLCMLTMGRPP